MHFECRRQGMPYFLQIINAKYWSAYLHILILCFFRTSSCTEFFQFRFSSLCTYLLSPSPDWNLPVNHNRLFIKVFWTVMFCRLKKFRCFREIYCIYLQGAKQETIRSRLQSRLFFCVVLIFNFDGSKKFPRDIQLFINYTKLTNPEDRAQWWIILKLDTMEQLIFVSFPLKSNCTRIMELSVTVVFCGRFPFIKHFIIYGRHSALWFFSWIKENYSSHIMSWHSPLSYSILRTIKNHKMTESALLPLALLLKRLIRPICLEKVQFVGVCKWYVQMEFTFQPTILY
jgi:hypothetical protein